MLHKELRNDRLFESETDRGASWLFHYGKTLIDKGAYSEKQGIEYLMKAMYNLPLCFMLEECMRRVVEYSIKTGVPLSVLIEAITKQCSKVGWSNYTLYLLAYLEYLSTGAVQQINFDINKIDSFRLDYKFLKGINYEGLHNAS
jgi:hypothetical protein